MRDAHVGRLSGDRFRGGSSRRDLRSPWIWCHPDVPPGRTVSAADDRGIPCLYAEARGAGRIDPADLACFRRGMMNVLKHLGISGESGSSRRRRDTALWRWKCGRKHRESVRGFLIPRVVLLETVVKGQPLGVLVDISGTEIDDFAAPCDGIVVLIHECPLVQPEEPLFLITRPM